MDLRRQQEMKSRLRNNQARLKRPEAATALSLILSQPINVNDFSLPDRSDSLIHIYCQQRQNNLLLERRFLEANRADLEQYLGQILSEKTDEMAVEVCFAKSEVLGTLIFKQIPEVSKLVDLLLWDCDDLWIFSLSEDMLVHLEFCDDEYLDPEIMDCRQPVFIIEHKK